MTKDQVKDLMGATGAETRDGVVSNPWSAENFNGKDGAKHEVLFYITRKNPPFTPIRKSLMTPVVFKGNKVIGWGPAALQEAGGSMK